MPETVRVPQQMAAGWGGLDDDGICDFKANQCSDILFSLPESSRPAAAPAALRAHSTEHLSDAVRALIARSEAANPPTRLRDIWDLHHLENLLSWMDGEFAHLLETGGDMEAAVTALVLRWRRTESRRSKVLDILFAQIPKDAIRDFIGALLTIKGLPKVRTLMPSLDRVVGRLRRQGIEIAPHPEIVKGVIVMR